MRALAERVCEALPPDATDVILTGSVSRGVADGLSDVELLVVCDEPPGSLPLDDLQTWSAGDSPARWLGGFLDGEFVELDWWPQGFAEERVDRIARGEIVDWQRLRTAEAIVNGVSLRGRRAAAWRERLARWPDGLTEAIVDDAASHWAEPPPRAVLRPGDALTLVWRVAEDGENVLRIVFALNREWPPGWKRLAERLAPLAVKPERLAERVDAALRALDLGRLRALATETLGLAPRSPAVERALRFLEEPL